MTTFTVKKPVDFIALSPVVLGFYPTRSVVMLTLGGFHARIDVPTPSEVDGMCHALLSPAKRHNITQVAFVVFGDGDNSDILQALRKAFAGEGIEVVATIEYDGNQYREFPGEWEAFDLASHPFTLEAHYADRVPEESRDDILRRIRPRGVGWGNVDVSLAVEKLLGDGLMGTVMSLSRSRAKQQLALWEEALRGADAGSKDATDIAFVLAYAFWLAGDGAGAWIALDLAADESSPHYELMSHLLNNAVNPATWPND